MIAAETILSNKNFTLKFSKKRIEATPGTGSCEQGQQVSFVDEQNHSSFVNASNQSEIKKMHNSVSCPSGSGKKLDPEYLKAKSSMSGSNKRGPLQLIECQREKRQKMDRSVASQCSTILKKLMTHPAGWVFNKPVDPAALNIPDYFSIIKNPMDLGTIKSKLVKNMYFGTEEFEADIRLTFSNAMIYNPPDNSVHKMAVELNNIFETRWKAFEGKWNRESLKVGQGKLLSGRVKETNDTRQNVDKAPPSHNNLLLKRSMPSVQKVTRTSDGRDVEVSNMLMIFMIGYTSSICVIIMNKLELNFSCLANLSSPDSTNLCDLWWIVDIRLPFFFSFFSIMRDVSALSELCIFC
jgi:hypothetical protein